MPEEPWDTLGPEQEEEGQAHTAASSCSSAELERKHEDFLSFAPAGQIINALAEHQSHLCLYRAGWKETCLAGVRKGNSGGTCFCGLWELLKALVEFWEKAFRLF